MSKKFVISSFVLVLFLVSAMPAWASMTVSEVNLVGEFNGQWPDFNGVPDSNGWSVAGTRNGRPPKAVTANDPNQLPSYASDFGSGTIRVFYTPVNGGSNTQTFSTDGNTDGFALTRIAIRISGGGSDIPDENYPFTVHIFDLNATYGYIPPAPGADPFIPANGIPYCGAYDFLSGPAFAADPCMLSVGTWDWDILLSLDFNGYDNVDLEPNHTYAFEVWGPTGWTAAPPYIWGMVWNALENTGPAGCGYQVGGSADNGNGPGASNLTNPRTLALGGIDRDFVVGVYGNYADGNAYHPDPRKYQTQVSLNPTLTWHPGKWAKNHQLWFGTTLGSVSRRLVGANKGRLQNPYYNIALDPCYPSGLALNTTYYWRVDEYNDTNTVPVPHHPDGNNFWGLDTDSSTTDHPTIYRFTTISPAAFNPVPATGAIPQIAVFTPQAAWLKWTAGALAATTNGHRVYFGTNWGDVNHVTEANDPCYPLYRGVVSDPCYPLKNLYSDYSLTSGTAYYWRVDEVNGATVWPGPVWNFKMPNPAYISIDDFSVSSADLSKFWQWGYEKNGGSLSVAGKVLTLNYDNSGTDGIHDSWSEAKLDYSYVSSTGVDWTLGGVYVPKVLAVQFDGNMGNTLYGGGSTDPNYGRLYMGLEDIAGNRGFIILKSDLYAAQRAITIDIANAAIREWKVALTDPNFSTVDLTEVNRVYLGIGVRGYPASGYGGMGALKFANLKVYVQHCNPTYPMTSAVAGDLAGSVSGVGGYRYTSPNCKVDYGDIFYLASDWLFNEPNLVYDSNVDPGTSNLTAYYAFDEGSGTTITDSQNGRNGTLYNAGPFTWAYAGHNGTGKCVNLEPGFHTWIECPKTVVPGTGTGQSFTFWLKYNDSFNEEHMWASVLVFHSNSPGVTGGALADNQTMETQLAVPLLSMGNAPWVRWVDMRPGGKETTRSRIRPSLISSRWNHYALVFDTTNTSMRMYINGVSDNNLTDTNENHLWGPNETGDGNANTVRIGQRSDSGYAITDGWGFWQGRIDDMRLYSKALSANEVQYLATDGTGKRNMQAVFDEPDNFSSTTVTIGGQPVQIVNFNDFAVLAGYWLNQQLWP